MAGQEMDKKEFFRRMYDRYSDDMYRFAFRVLRNESDTQDAVQNALIRLYEHLDTVMKINQRSDGKEKAYILMIVKNTAVDIFKKNKGDVQLYNTMVMDREFRRAVLGYELPKSEADRERELMLEECLKELKTEYLEAIDLFYYEGYTQKEIAEVLGISEQLAGVRLHRARKAVKHLMKKRGYDKWFRLEQRETEV